MGFLGNLVGFLGGLGSWTSTALTNIFTWAGKLINKLGGVFRSVAGFFRGIWRHLQRVWDSLAQIKHSALWVEVDKWYKRYRRWKKWYNDHVLGPIHAIQNLIHNLYKTVFAPVIETIDSIRVMLDTLLIFNRGLARRVDGALFGLEAKILSPILFLTRRVNALSSTITAILTRNAHLDGTIFIATVSRHIRELRHIFAGFEGNHVVVVRPGPAELAQRNQSEIHQWVKSGDGPFADEISGALESARELRRALDA